MVKRGLKLGKDAEADHLALLVRARGYGTFLSLRSAITNVPGATLSSRWRLVHTQCG